MLPAEYIDTQEADAPAVRLTPLGEYEGSLANRTYLSLRASILELDYRPGEALRKADICSQLGVSRSPVAEAISRLAGEGLVDVVPQAGTYVARFSMEEIREGAFLREAIEVTTIERVAEAINDEQLVQLRRNLRVQDALVADGDTTGFYRLDGEMHRLLLSFSGFRRIAQTADTAWVHVNRARRVMLPVPGRVEETVREHWAIFDALERRDPVAAREAMQHHLRQLLTFLEPLENEHPELFSPE